MAIKDQAVTVTYYALDTDNKTGKTGDNANHTLRLVSDGTEATPGNSPAEVDSTNAPGVYKITITADENDGEFMMLCGKSSTSNVVIIPVIWENVVNLSHISGTAVSTSSAQIGVNIVSIDDDAITAAKIADGAIDAGAIASDAITAAKIAADAIGASELASDAVAEIVDAVWDETAGDHTSSGSTGEKLAAITDTAITSSSLVQGSAITFIIGATFSETLTGFTISSTWNKMYFSVKRKKSDSEDDAIVRILVTDGGDVDDGLERLQKAATTAAWGSLTVDQNAGTIAPLLKPNATILLQKLQDAYYDFKEILDDGTENIVAEGTVDINYTPTQAIT